MVAAFRLSNLRGVLIHSSDDEKRPSRRTATIIYNIKSVIGDDDRIFLRYKEKMKDKITYGVCMSRRRFPTCSYSVFSSFARRRLFFNVFVSG